MPSLSETYLAQAQVGEHGEHWSGPPQMVEEIAAVVGTRPHHRVLDVGTGIGGPARRLARMTGCRVLGVDVLPPLLTEARRRTSDDRVRFAAASAEALPFRDACFDQAWCLGVAAHVEDIPGLALELARVLSPRGVACFTEAFWDGRRVPRFGATAPRPWAPLTASRLIGALLAAGFREAFELPWPGRPFSADEHVTHPELRSDLLAGRLCPAMVVAPGR